MNGGGASSRSLASRLFAGAIAVAGWSGLVIFFDANYAATGSVAEAIGRMAPYFTILTNLGLAIVFTGLAIGPRGFEAPRVTAGVTLAILMVGVVYFTLLRGEVVFTGRVAAADALLHAATPALAPAYWLLFVRKGALKRFDPWLFGLAPLVYFGVTIARGAIVGTYPYQFLNVARFGMRQTLLNALPIAVVFMLAAWAMVLLDRLLARRAGGRSAVAA